jgi:hypothetical protein
MFLETIIWKMKLNDDGCRMVNTPHKALIEYNSWDG